MIVLSMSFLVAGCGGTNEANGSARVETDREMTVFVDDCGREVEVPADIQTIVASGNLAQIFIYAIAPDSLMAIAGVWTDDAKDYVDEKYVDLPEVGSFFGNHDLNYEEIAKLGPDIIIDVGEDKPTMKSDLNDITQKTGIPAVHISAYDDSMDEAFQKLGVLLGREVEGNELSAYCSYAYETAVSVSEAAEANGGKTTLLYCTQEDGQNVLAKDSYHSSVIDLLSDNLAVLQDPSSEGSGNEVNLEQMLIWDPEVIIFAPGSYFDYAADDPAWMQLKAVKNDLYYEVPSGPYNWMGSPPSSNRILGMLWMADLLYPELTEFDIKEETMRYYQLFYHCNLTDEQYERLVMNSITKRNGMK